MSAPSIVVLDYGSGNLNSACRALDAAGARVELLTPGQVARAGSAERAQGLVVPGVGAFAACMQGLQDSGGADLVREWDAAGLPLLGICVGHQIFFDAGIEHQRPATGLGLLGGQVEPVQATRLPHMGWNHVEPPSGSVLFAGIEDQRFYFVHSYAAHQVDAGTTGIEPQITWAEHEQDRFVAAVERGHLSSVQFHPEKSGAAGERLLRNWLTGATH